MTITAIDINALEWFDRVNGNSYFAGTITLNYGTPEQLTLYMPFQYGYGDSYKDEAFKTLRNAQIITDMEEYLYQREGKTHSNGYETGWRYCDRKGIILRSNKREKCKQRELKEISKLAAELNPTIIK